MTNPHVFIFPITACDPLFTLQGPAGTPPHPRNTTKLLVVFLATDSFAIMLLATIPTITPVLEASIY